MKAHRMVMAIAMLLLGSFEVDRALAQQEARLWTAQAELKRVKPLAEANAVSLRELDESQGNFEQRSRIAAGGDGARRRARLRRHGVSPASQMARSDALCSCRDQRCVRLPGADAGVGGGSGRPRTKRGAAAADGPGRLRSGSHRACRVPMGGDCGAQLPSSPATRGSAPRARSSSATSATAPRPSWWVSLLCA